MQSTKKISSLQNPLVKQVILLKEKSRERKKTGLFVTEGWREIQLALKGGYQIETLFFQPDIISHATIFDMFEHLEQAPLLIETSNEIYQKLAYRDTTEGVLAILKSKSHTLDNLVFKNKKPLLLVAEAPEKPGNIGALLRTADAANLDAVIIANAKTDVYNPNIIRSSVGCIFTNTLAVGTTSEIIEFLKIRNIAIHCAALSAPKIYTTVDFKDASAIIVGTEATGLSQEWLDNSTQNIIIPMAGKIDSMNVSVSAAILIFEAKRQRGF